uniref:Uncharacterized protein n=1 Tax=Pristionchus pacificus TaxID=54126 RepID=A0A2A6B6R1_PRIPA|eukprot:PDM61551.1 hypothetical protein PRIPAC_50993 [Pristionchus pacificus]
MTTVIPEPTDVPPLDVLRAPEQGVAVGLEEPPLLVPAIRRSPSTMGTARSRRTRERAMRVASSGIRRPVGAPPAHVSDE